MREIHCLLQIILRTICDLRQAAGFVYTFLSAFFSSRATLAARVLAAESQLAACKRRIVEKDRPRPRFTPAFRLLWVLLSRIWDEWHQVAHLMQPATVKRWHTTAFRLYWRRKSRGRPGRPPISKGMQDLIRKLSQENSLWSAERIRDTLLLLGYDPPCIDTIRKDMVHPKTRPEKPTTWLPFLRSLPRHWYFFLLSLTAGLLVFLGVDALEDALENAAQVPEPY
ncbi:MAG: helix-turn-helix domain-containing protein, partial [Acidobacteriota bacterium]